VHLARCYLPHASSTRQRITRDVKLSPLVAPGAAPGRVLAFLVQFSARGVQMTEPVEGWIRRAGQRCQELGLTRLGRTLVEHAKHEAGHHELMLEDLALLRERWAHMGYGELDTARLLAQAPTSAMKRYVAIHEDTIASDMPFGQIAIETEVERMSTVLGPALIEACRAALGEEVLSAMSFIRDHTELDVGHTAMNEAELDRLLADHPELGEPLARIGGEALSIYLDFLGECVDAGDALLEQAVRRSA
jgi:hypothetical protein